MNINAIVVLPDGVEQTFSCIAHRTEDAENRLIEPEFYQKWCAKAIPQGTHHELELLNAIHASPQSERFIHVHIHPTTGKKFVCWTGSLPTIEAARTVFRVWCVGTAIALEYFKDFGSLYTGDAEAFLELAKRDYRIHLTELKEDASILPVQPAL